MFAFGIPNPLVFLERPRKYSCDREASEDERDCGRYVCHEFSLVNVVARGRMRTETRRLAFVTRVVKFTDLRLTSVANVFCTLDTLA
jgi:hypothetical protein